MSTLQDLEANEKFQSLTLAEKSKVIGGIQRSRGVSERDAQFDSLSYPTLVETRSGSSLDKPFNKKKLAAIRDLKQTGDTSSFEKSIIDIENERNQFLTERNSTMNDVAELTRHQDLQQPESETGGDASVTDRVSSFFGRSFDGLSSLITDEEGEESIGDRLVEINSTLGDQADSRVDDFKLRNLNRFEGNSTVSPEGDIILRNDMFLGTDEEIKSELQGLTDAEGNPLSNEKIDLFIERNAEVGRASVVQNTLDVFNNDSVKRPLFGLIGKRRDDFDSDLEYARFVRDKYKADEGETDTLTGTLASAQSSIAKFAQGVSDILGFAEASDSFGDVVAKQNHIRSLAAPDSIVADIGGVLPDLVPVAKGAQASRFLATNVFKLGAKGAGRVGVAAANVSGGLVAGVKTFSDVELTEEEIIGLSPSEIEDARRAKAFKFSAYQAFVTAGVSTAIKGNAVEKVLGKGTLVNKNLNNSLARGLTENAKRFGISVNAEGIEEAADEFISHLVVQMQIDPSAKPEDAIEAARQAYVVGAALGAPFEFANMLANKDQLLQKSVDETKISTADKSLDQLRKTANVIKAEASTEGNSRDLTTDNRKTKIQDEPTTEPDSGNDRNDTPDSNPEANTEEVSDPTTPDTRGDEATSEADIQQQASSAQEESGTDVVELTPSESNDAQTIEKFKDDSFFNGEFSGLSSESLENEYPLIPKSELKSLSNKEFNERFSEFTEKSDEIFDAANNGTRELTNDEYESNNADSKAWELEKFRRENNNIPIKDVLFSTGSIFSTNGVFTPLIFNPKHYAYHEAAVLFENLLTDDKSLGEIENTLKQASNDQIELFESSIKNLVKFTNIYNENGSTLTGRKVGSLDGIDFSDFTQRSPSESKRVETDSQPELSTTDDTQTSSSDVDSTPESSGRDTPAASTEVAQEESSGSQESTPLSDNIDEAKQQVVKEIIATAKNGNITKDEAVALGKRLEQVDSVEEVQKVSDNIKSLNAEPSADSDIKTSDNDLSPAEQKFKDRVINNVTAKGGNASRAVSSSTLFATNPTREVEITNDAIIESLGAEQAGQIISKIQNVESDTGVNLNEQIDITVGKRQDKGKIDKSQLSDLVQTRLLKSIHNKIKNGQSVDEAVQSTLVRDGKTRDNVILRAIKTIRENQERSKTADELNRNTLDTPVESSRKTLKSSQIKGAKITESSAGKQRAFIDSGAMGHVSSQLKKGETVSVVDVDQPALSKVVKSVSSLFGAKVVFYQTNNPDSNVDDGFTLAGDNTIYINVDSSRSVDQIIGHEAAHVLQTENTELFNSLMDSLIKNGIINEASDVYKNFLKKRGYQTNNYDQQFYKEFTADVIGRIFEDATHLDKFRSDVNNDKAFKRFTNALLMFVNKLKLKLRDLVSDLLPNANGQMFNTVNDSLRATYILHEALSGAAHSNGVPSYNNEAHNNTFRLTTLQNQAEGFVNPQAQSFMDLTDVNSSKPVKGKKSKKKTINEGSETSTDFKKFVAEANPLKDTAVSEIKKIAEERGWVKGDTPLSSLESIVRNFSGASARNAKNVKELVSRIKENYQGQYDLNDSVDGDVIAAVGIKLAMIDNLRDEPNSDRKEELFSAIAASDVVINRGANVTSLNEQIRLSGQVLSVLGNLGADAEGSGYRYFAGLSISASLGLKKNNINTLGENDHKKIVDSLNDDNDQTRILALMEENSRISETLSSSLGALKRQREANKKLVDRLIKQIEQFRGVVSSSAKNNAENRLDAVLAQLHQVAVINSETDINDIETLVDDANKTVDILDNIDFDFLTKNPKFKRSAEAVRQSNDEAKNTLDQVNEDTLGEAEENDGDYFLTGKIFGFKKSIKNAIKNRDVSEHQRIYGIESTKFKIGESTLEQAVADISASEPFAEASIDKITEALKQDLKTTELLAKESSLQKGKRKIYEAQKRQIQARKDKPKAVKKYSPADTLSKLNKGTLTLDEAIVEIRSNIDGVIDEHVEAYLLEGIKTSNKRAKARLQSSVDRHIGESVHGSVLKLARSLGVSSFKSQQIGVKSWSDMSSLEKIKAVKDSEFIPKSAESKSSIDAIVAKLDTIDGQSTLDTESSIDALESVNTTIKESKTPPSSSLSNWLKTKIQEDPLFWHELPSKKLDVIREYFEQGRNDPEMAGVFSELVDGKVTDTSLNRLAEVSMKRLEKAAKQLADQKAERLKDQLENSRFSVAELSEGIMMGLFDKTVSRDAIVSNMLGLDFKISSKGIAQIAANRKVIEGMIADGVPDPYNTDAGIKALKDIKRVLTRELKDFNGSIWDTLMAADTASILSSGMTTSALPFLSAFSLASSAIKQLMQVVWNNRNNPDFSKADRLQLLKENFVDAFNLKDIGAASVNGLMHGSHAIGDANLTSKSNDSLDAHISVLDARLQKLEFSRNKLAEMKSTNAKLDEELLKQYSIVVRDVVLSIVALPTTIFNVMQGVTEIFAEPARKLNLAMEAQEQILQGELTLKQYRGLRQAASDKAKSSLEVIENLSPNIPWYSKRVQVNQILHQEIFQAYVQDFDIQDAMHSMHSAHLTAVGISGDTNESIGPIGVITKDISNFLGKPLTKEERNPLGYASKGVRFTAGLFFKFFGSASHSLDAAVYYTPIGYTMTLALNKGWINSEHNTGFRKRLAEAVENYNRTGRARKERFQEMLIGLPALVGYMIQSFLTDDEEERLFYLDLSYPDRAKEQVQFMEESDRREYKLYINTPQGRIGLDMGRGAAPQLLGNLIIAERIKRAVDRSDEDGVGAAIGIEGVNLLLDGISLGSPFIDSIITEVQRHKSEGGGSARRLNNNFKKNLARFIDVVPSGFANDVDKIRFGRRSVTDDAPLLAHMPSLQLFNQFSEYKGKRLDQRGQSVDGDGFWNMLSAINSPVTFSERDVDLMSGDMRKAYEIRKSVNYGIGTRSDYKTWSKGFFGAGVPLNVKNAYAVSRGYTDSQEMHEVAILTRTKIADRATAKLGSSKALKQHALDMKNPVGNTSQARVASRKKIEEQATAILASPYTDATTLINKSGRFRDHNGKSRRGLDKKGFKKFFEEYKP